MFSKKILHTLLLFLLMGQEFLTFSQPGDLDKSFGANGIVVTEFETIPAGNYAIINGITTHEDRIIVAGKIQATTPLMPPIGIVARYTNKGRLDLTFNGYGYITSENALYNAVTIDAASHNNGNTLLTTGAGYLYDQVGHRTSEQFILSTAEATPNWQGNFDDTLLTFPSSLRSEAHTIAIDSESRVIIAGSVVDQNNARHFGLARTYADGSIDTSFGTQGFVQTSISDTPNKLEKINAVAIAPDDSIAVAGQALINGEKRFVAARYTKDGALDTTFGTLVDPTNPQGARTGIVTVDFALVPTKNDSAQGLLFQRDGKLVVAGYACNFLGTFSIVMVRFTREGSLDYFGNDRIGTDPVLTLNRFGSISVRAHAITQQKDGSLVVAGTVIAPFLNDPKKAGQQFVVARYSSEGKLDTSFGDNGKVYMSFNNEGAEAKAVVIDEDENIVVGGYNFSDEGVARFALTRYLSS